MKLSEIKKHLSTTEAVSFELQNGALVPRTFPRYGSWRGNKKLY